MPPLLILYLAFHWSMNCDAVCTMSKFNKKLRYTVFHSLTLEWQKYEHSPLISERLFPRVAQRLIRSLNFGSGWWVHVLRCLWATWSPLWSSASYHTPSGEFFFFFFFVTRCNWAWCLPEYQFLQTWLFAVGLFDSPSFEDSMLQLKSLLHKSFLAAVKYCLRW